MACEGESGNEGGGRAFYKVARGGPRTAQWVKRSGDVVLSIRWTRYRFEIGSLPLATDNNTSLEHS